MHVFFCLFVCDTAFRCTLEKTDLFVLVAVHMLRLHAYVSNKLDWIHKVTPVHMYKLCITLTQSSLCCRIQLVNQRVCVCVGVGVCCMCVCVYSAFVGVRLRRQASEPEEKTVFRACSPLL